jgi:hypothetical protein
MSLYISPFRRRNLLWIALGLLALGIQYLGAARPDWIEQWYSRRLFPIIRSLIDYLFAWLPFPLLNLFVVVTLVLLGWNLYRWLSRPGGWWEKSVDGLLGLLGFAGGALFLFYFLWGWNYQRVPLEVQLELQPLEPLSEEELWQGLQEETVELLRLREGLYLSPEDSVPTEKLMPAQLERSLRNSLYHWLAEQDYPVPGRVRGKLVFPKGILLRFSSSGLYFPFTGEGHVDAGLHPLEVPYVMAHEMGHGMGFGDEGTCNFLAYVTCRGAKNAYVQYAGQLTYWRTLAVQVKRHQPEKYQAFREALPPGLVKDLNAINQNQARYPDLLPEFRDKAYNTYLRSQGISEGMKNYNRVLMLVNAWKASKRS